VISHIILRNIEIRQGFSVCLIQITDVSFEENIVVIARYPSGDMAK